MNTVEFVIGHQVTLLVCGFLILTMGRTMTRDIGGLQEIRYFRVLTWTALTVALCDSIWTMVHLPNVNFTNTFMRFLCFINLSCSAIGPLCLYSFSFASLSRLGIIRESKLHAYFKHIPVGFMIVLHIISYWTGYTFSIDSEGFFVSGPLYGLQLFVCLGYLVATVGLALYVDYTSHYTHHVDALRLPIATVFVFLGGLGQVFVPSAPLVTIGNAFGMVYLTVSLLRANVTTDALTGLTNRGKMNMVLDEKFETVLQKPFTLYLADVDSFKQINDNYGHQEGDAALVRVANAFRKLGMKHRSLFIARYGGDEFLFTVNHREKISQKDLENELQEYVDDEQKKASANYRITMRVGGYDVTSKMDTKELAMENADLKLYEQKKLLHGKKK